MASCCASVITPSISCLSRWRICWICCRFCCIESDEFAHTASTCWRACCVIMRRCCIAALETPATAQQGSSRGFVVPGAVEGLGSCVSSKRCRENDQSQQCREYSLV